MTPFMSLLLPIVVSAVAVFILSSIIHMVMPWHKGDYARLANEDAVMNALRPFEIPPDDYVVPRPTSSADMKSPEFIAKRDRGPVIVMTVMPPGPFKMGMIMGQWFVFLLLVSTIAGCLAASVVAPGGGDHSIFHYSGIAAFLSYTLGSWPLSIWYHRKWSTTIKGTVDGLIYAAVTGWIFVMMWPKA